MLSKSDHENFCDVLTCVNMGKTMLAVPSHRLNHFVFALVGQENLASIGTFARDLVPTKANPNLSGFWCLLYLGSGLSEQILRNLVRMLHLVFDAAH